jgi:alkanesulfonate monooxygenase SsuD/methylene tetrahydromethanopterin reductase-like flavin-dependent oxidoreductase (luciferase family)
MRDAAGLGTLAPRLRERHQVRLQALQDVADEELRRRHFDHAVCAWVHGSAAADRESAVDGLWPEVGRSVMHAVRTGYRDVPDATKRELAGIALRQDKEFELSARLRDLFGDEILDDYTVVGTYDQCHRRLRGLLAASGVTEAAVNVYPATPQASVSETLAKILAAA